MKKRLITTGGVGSGFLQNLLLPVLHNVDRHRRKPNLKGYKRILYVFGNPYNQIISFYNRGFLTAPYKACKHVRGNVKKLRKKKKWSLSEYLENGKDYFKLKEHFLGYWNYDKRDYEIMFVKYENIPEVWKEIFDFMELPKPICRFKRRTSNYKIYSKHIKKLLKEMYGDYKKIVDSLPSYTIKGR